MALSPFRDDIWFDDVDPEDIEAAVGPEAADIVRKRLGQHGSGVSLEKDQGFGGLTRALALDCEMVGVGPTGEDSMAARVSLVNQHGKCVYDKYIRPTEPVTDYRTAISGIRPQDLQQGEELAVVQREVAGLLEGRLLVGHALHNDLKVTDSSQGWQATWQTIGPRPGAGGHGPDSGPRPSRTRAGFPTVPVLPTMSCVRPVACVRCGGPCSRRRAPREGRLPLDEGVTQARFQPRASGLAGLTQLSLSHCLSRFVAVPQVPWALASRGKLGISAWSLYRGRCPPCAPPLQSGQPSLKLLSEQILGLRVQQSEHCSIQDAQVAMRLYVLARKEWESGLKGKQRTPTARPDAHSRHEAC
ncbi:RNA exonuclease 4 [Echinops telfairi]|uniref:RNA exonuclease 4 n=1 Tax=Echinops telfairi TaxID=9371 RepID=A0AC55D0N1_ECHTE|nr:RNA exonuclease 4 [Echinops telfairi]